MRRLVLAMLVVVVLATLWQLRAEETATAGLAAKPPPPTPVVTVEATMAALPIRLEAVGWVEPVATVAVQARLDAQVVEQRVQDGQMVDKDALLFRLDDRSLKAALARDQAILARDQAAAVQATAELKRATALLANRAGSRQLYDAAVAAAKVAEATVEASRATVEADRIELSYSEIRAPIAGRAGAVAVTPGNLAKSANGAAALVTLTQMAPVRVRFTVADRFVDQVRRALAAQAPVAVHSAEDGRRLAQGRLDFIDSTIDGASGTLTVKATVANGDLALWPGQYVRVTAELGQHPVVPVIPTAAIQQGPGGAFVYVVSAAKTAAIRAVTVLGEDGARSAVGAGVAAGEAVVVEGQGRLTNGAPVAEKGR